MNVTEIEDYYNVGTKSTADVAKDYLRQAIKQKSKQPLIKCKQYLSKASLSELMKLMKDKEIQELLLVIDRNLLPEIEPGYVPYGPPITASKIRKIVEEHFE